MITALIQEATVLVAALFLLAVGVLGAVALGFDPWMM
jgi:hypothetical protein